MRSSLTVFEQEPPRQFPPRVEAYHDEDARQHGADGAHDDEFDDQVLWVVEVWPGAVRRGMSGPIEELVPQLRRHGIDVDFHLWGRRRRPSTQRATVIDGDGPES